MTTQQLIEEGRKIQKPTNFLKPSGSGEPVAMWFEVDSDDESITGWRRWMTVRGDALPNSKVSKSVFFSLYTQGCESGLIDFVDDWPPVSGTPLYLHPASVLPPIEAVFVLGSDEVGKWLDANNWSRNDRYNSNFRDASVVHGYEQVWAAEHPLFRNDPDIYAVTGGWHTPGADSDWHDLVSAKLILTTFRDSEPWVELFQLPDTTYKVIQRIT